MMKVLQVNATYGLGSTGTIVRELKENCEANGFDCYVAYAKSSVKFDRGYKIGNWFFNKLHALLARIAGKQAYFSFLPTLMFINFLRKLQPDVVHLHNLHSFYINLPMLLKYLAKNDIRTIITLHDCWWYTGGCFHYTAVGCSKWLDNCDNCPKRYADTQAYLCDKASRVLSDRKKLLLAIPRLTVVGVSEWISNEARKSFLASKDILTIRNGIDHSIFKPTSSDLRKRLGLTDKYIILGPASKWLDSKNRKVLQYFAANMQPDEILLLFGAEKTNVRLPSNVKLFGYTRNKHELAALDTMADVFVNCTREDSLSLINIESQACGTPVVTFDATGPKETVDGKTGFSVTVGDPQSLYEKVMTLREAADDDFKCRAFVYEEFDKIKNNKNYIHLYAAEYQ